MDDNEDMAHLYLTRKLIQYQQSEVLLNFASSNAIVPQHAHRSSSYRSGSILSSNYWVGHVEDLEMLLEAYFMQLDGIRNKILSVSRARSVKDHGEVFLPAFCNYVFLS